MALVTVLLWASPDLLWWMAPTVFGLLLAVVLSKISGDLAVGDRVRGLGLFLTPEETAPPAVLVARDAEEAELVPLLARVRLASVLADPEARARHLAAVFDDQPRERGQPDVPLLTARQKISDAGDWGDVVGWLDGSEWMAALSSEELMARLAKLARSAAT
jgi:membrane glycosyltransferase